MGQNALSFIGPSISNKTPRGSQKKQKALILSNITLKKYYQTQFKAENKLWSCYQNYYNYPFANYLFVIIIIINHQQYYLLS